MIAAVAAVSAVGPAFAGDAVMWGEVVARDLETGADVVRLKARDLGTRGIDEPALQEDGAVV